MSTTTMTYGDYSFSPVPIITNTKEYVKSQDQINVTANQKLTLNGVLIDLDGGLPGIMTKIRALREALNADGKYFTISFGGQLVFQCYPRIGNIEFNPTSDNWTATATYSVELEFDNIIEGTASNELLFGNLFTIGSGDLFDIGYTNLFTISSSSMVTSGEDTAYFGPFLQSVSESWEVQFDEQSVIYTGNTSVGPDINPVVMRVTHNVGAVGKSHYSGPGTNGTLDIPAWQQAQTYVVPRLGFDYSKVFPYMPVAQSSGIFGYYDHFRVAQTDETAGSYNVTETWAILETGHIGISRKAIEDFTVEIRKGVEQEFNSVSIQGTIQGLEDRSYGNNIGDFTINTDRFVNASGYWGSIKDGLFIFPRVQAIIANESFTLNPIPLNKSVTKSPPQGNITYSYEYYDKPVNCLTGAKSENIVIQDVLPTRIINELTIMGRPQGPVLQDLNTYTSFQRTVNIDVLMSGRPGCNYSLDYSPRNQVNSVILCEMDTELRAAYSDVYKTQDVENWDPRFGRYSRIVSWVAVDCGTEPDISVC